MLEEEAKNPGNIKGQLDSSPGDGKSHGNLAIGLSNTQSAEISRQVLYRPKLFCGHTEGYKPLRNLLYSCIHSEVVFLFFSVCFTMPVGFLTDAMLGDILVTSNVNAAQQTAIIMKQGTLRSSPHKIKPGPHRLFIIFLFFKRFI